MRPSGAGGDTDKNCQLSITSPAHTHFDRKPGQCWSELTMFVVWAMYELLLRPKLSAVCDWMNWPTWVPVDQSQTVDSSITKYCELCTGGVALSWVFCYLSWILVFGNKLVFNISTYHVEESVSIKLSKFLTDSENNPDLTMPHWNTIQQCSSDIW